VAELPRDSNGKLYKRRLRDPYRKTATGSSEIDAASLALIPDRHAHLACSPLDILPA